MRFVPLFLVYYTSFMSVASSSSSNTPSNAKYNLNPQLNDRTSGIPNLCCQVGKLGESSTNGRYNENGKRAVRSLTLEQITLEEGNY